MARNGRRQFGRVRKLPSGRWQARYPDGVGRDVTAPATFATKSDANRFLAEVQADLQRGVWCDPRLGQVTFASWAEQWLASNPDKRRTTRARDESALRVHFLPVLGHRGLATITPVHVRDAVHVMATKVGPNSVRTNVGVLRAVFNAAVEADLIACSPVRGLRLAKPQRRRRPTLTPDELLGFADAMPSRYRALVLVGGVLGLRWSEAIGLRVGDVDFMRRTISVRQTIAEVDGRLNVAVPRSPSSERPLSVPGFLIDELAAISPPTAAGLRLMSPARVMGPPVRQWHGTTSGSSASASG